MWVLLGFHRLANIPDVGLRLVTAKIEESKRCVLTVPLRGTKRKEKHRSAHGDTYIKHGIRRPQQQKQLAAAAAPPDMRQLRPSTGSMSLPRHPHHTDHHQHKNPNHPPPTRGPTQAQHGTSPNEIRPPRHHPPLPQTPPLPPHRPIPVRHDLPLPTIPNNTRSHAIGSQTDAEQPRQCTPNSVRCHVEARERDGEGE